MFLKSSLLMTSGLGFDTYVREEVREERVQVKKPHVILIMTDQHRGDALGCMGIPLSYLRILIVWRKRELCL